MEESEEDEEEEDEVEGLLNLESEGETHVDIVAAVPVRDEDVSECVL